MKDVKKSLGEIIATWLGILGGLAGFFSLWHSCQIEDRTQRQSCISDLSLYPQSLRVGGQEMTDTLLKWVVTPDVTRRVAAKRAAETFQGQLGIMIAQEEKYKISDDHAKKLSASVDQIISSISEGDVAKPNLDAYSSEMNDFVRSPARTTMCPK